jgi:hypothetical protein
MSNYNFDALIPIPYHPPPVVLVEVVPSPGDVEVVAAAMVVVEVVAEVVPVVAVAELMDPKI